MSWRYSGEYMILLSGCLLTLLISQLLKLDTTKLLLYHWTWGPCARTCVNLVRGRLKVEKHLSNVSSAADKFALSPQTLLGLVREFDADEVSHALIFVRPMADSRGQIRAEIPTRHLSGILALAVARVDAAHQSQFFSLISSHPWTATLAGWMFEKFVHVRLASSVPPPLTCVPADVAKERFIVPECHGTIPLNGTTGLSAVNQHLLPSYWRPTSHSFTSIDGIVATDSHIPLFQATISSQHGVKISGLDAIHDSLPAKFSKSHNWGLVFITSSEKTARNLRNQKITLPERWKDLGIYSCTFMIGKLDEAEEKMLVECIVSCVLFLLLPLIRMICAGRS